MHPTTRRRLLLWTPFGVILLLVLAWLFRSPAIPVDLAAVERGPLQVTVSDEGETRVRDVFVVSAPVAGLMRRVELEAGDNVVAGETLIARIEPTDPSMLDRRSSLEARAAVDAAEAARTHAEAQIRRAQADAEFAAAEFQRIEALADKGTVSRNDRDAAANRARSSAAAVEEAKAALVMRESELRQARARLLNPNQRRQPAADCDCVSVIAPISGAILRIVKESEGVVQPGEPIIEIGDPRNMEVLVDLLSADAVRVAPSQRVMIEAWGGEAPLAGIVRRVEPFGFTKISALGIEEQRVNVIIDFTDPPERWSRLGHGYRVEPRIVLWESQDALRAPLSALFREGDRWAVFVDNDGRAELRVVKPGHENGRHTEILDGLKEGEMIVAHPNERVADGVRIEAR